MQLEHFSTLAKALSDPQRLRAFMALRQGELCVCQIIQLLGLAPSTVSKHMTILKSAGLVQSRKDSRWVHYRLAQPAQHHATQQIIALATALLEDDSDILKDQQSLASIKAEELSALCLKQRCT
jgi:arsenate reductase/ArsR family transcriptional regulator